MNYLTLVNSVLRRLREAEVASVSTNSYSKLVGDFVNDAKRMVEDSWDWSGLRDTKTVTTSDGTQEYTLTGVDHSFKLLDANNDTSNGRLQHQSQAWLNNNTVLNDAATGVPSNFIWSGNNGSPDYNATVKLYPTPDGVYSLKFDVVDRTPVFTHDTNDTVSVPSAPIIAYALALAARERGETGGASSQELYSIADACLADAIAMDAARFPTETIWYAV
tara:strand:- start:485 stop:1141 length:657 start_codon:yes stop_codon:yes gene_type:complete